MCACECFIFLFFYFHLINYGISYRDYFPLFSTVVNTGFSTYLSCTFSNGLFEFSAKRIFKRPSNRWHVAANCSAFGNVSIFVKKVDWIKMWCADLCECKSHSYTCIYLLLADGLVFVACCLFISAVPYTTKWKSIRVNSQRTH